MRQPFSPTKKRSLNAIDVPLTLALHRLSQAREELRKELVECSEEWAGKVTVLEAEVGHVLKLAERYMVEMKEKVA